MKFISCGRRGLYPGLFLCALLGVVLNQVLFLEGLSRSTAVNAGLLMPLIPVYTFLVAWIARQERFSALRGLGILIAFSGTTYLLLQKEPDDRPAEAGAADPWQPYSCRLRICSGFRLRPG